MDGMKTAALLALGVLTVGNAVGCGGGPLWGGPEVVYVSRVASDLPTSRRGYLECQETRPNGRGVDSHVVAWQDCCPEGFAAVGWNNAMGGVVCLEGG